MSNDILTEHKLLILYFMSSINSSINSMDITNFLIENNYTDYLTAQQYFAELSEQGLINLYQNDKKVFYKINEKGLQTLELFNNRLSSGNRNVVDTYLKDFQDLSTNTLHATFDYDIIDDDVYNIKCSISKDKKTLYNLEIPNVSKVKLDKIKDKWETNKLSIMKYLKDNLIN